MGLSILPGLTRKERGGPACSGSRSRCRSTGTWRGRISERRGAGAGGSDVLVAGGAGVGQQYLAGGLLDELEISVVPLRLGGGARLFDGQGDADIQLEQVRVVDAPRVTHIRYRVRSAGGS